MQKFISGLLLAILGLGMVGCDPAPKTPKDWSGTSTMDLSYIYDSKININYLTSSFSFTYNKDSKDMKTQSVNLVADLTSNDIIMGNKKASDPKDNFTWGLDCSSPDSKCTKKSAAVTKSYHGYNYLASNYLTVTSLFGGVDLSDSEPNLEVWLAEQPDQYKLPFGENGVFGLGPKSSFFSYLQNSAYNFTKTTGGQNFDFGLAIFTQDDTARPLIQTGNIMGLFDHSSLSLRDWDTNKVNATIGVRWTEASTLTENWQTTGKATLFKFTTDRKSSTQLITAPNVLCISPNFNGLIGLNSNDYSQFKQAIGPLSDNPTLSLRIDTFKDGDDPKTTKQLQVEFRTEEFSITNYETQPYTVVEVKAASADDFEKATGCKMDGQNQPWVLGRLFFQRNYAVFRAQLLDNQGKPLLNGPRYIGFTQYLPLDKITKGERVILMIFGAFMVTLILIALCVRIGKGSSDEGKNDGEKYSKVQQADLN